MIRKRKSQLFPGGIGTDMSQMERAVDNFSLDIGYLNKLLLLSSNKDNV